MLHPTLTSLSLSLFKCYNFEGGVNRVYQEMSLKCFGKEHLKFLFMVGVPMIIVWVAGLPLLGFTLLCCNRKKLNDPKFMQKYVILYIGLREKRFFWEFVNTFRKITILCFSLAIPLDKGVLKSLVCVIFLYIIMRLQLKLKPYRMHMLNTLEGKEITASTITLFGTIVF